MKKTKRLYRTLFIISLLIVTSCATTTLKTVSRDNAYQGPVKKALVIGVSKNEEVRKFFEDQFVTRLKRLGTDAVSSHTIISSEDMLDKETIGSRIRNLDIDAVLVSTLIGRKKVDTHLPKKRYDDIKGRRVTWHRYYVESYETETRHDYTLKKEIVKVKTNLYDRETEKLVWSAVSDTTIKGIDYKAIKALINILVKNLSRERLIQ